MARWLKAGGRDRVRGARRERAGIKAARGDGEKREDSDSGRTGFGIRLPETRWRGVVT